MSLRPAATVVLGNLRYDAQLAAVSASLALLPGVNTFEATLPAGVKLTASTGDTASLELDGGEGAEAVLTGKIRRFHRRLMETVATGTDGGTELAAFRPRATYEKLSAADIIQSLASEAGVAVDAVDIDLPLPAYVAHQNRTAAEHIALLARLGGAMAIFDSQGKLQVKPLPSEPEIALLHGREIIACEVRQHSAPSARRFVIGSGPAGSPSAPNALRPSAGFLPDDAPSAGADAIRTPSPLLRTPSAARTASAAASAVAQAEASRLSAHCFLLPALRPGQVAQIQSLPEGLPDGPWLITRVEHRFDPAVGGTTLFEGRLGVSSGGFDLLGSALSAVGSLL